LHVEVENKDVAIIDFCVFQAAPDLWLVSLSQLIHSA
jgi:hypothetical protein